MVNQGDAYWVSMTVVAILTASGRRRQQLVLFAPACARLSQIVFLSSPLEIGVRVQNKLLPHIHSPGNWCACLEQCFPVFLQLVSCLPPHVVLIVQKVLCVRIARATNIEHMYSYACAHVGWRALPTHPLSIWRALRWTHFPSFWQSLHDPFFATGEEQWRACAR